MEWYAGYGVTRQGLMLYLVRIAAIVQAAIPVIYNNPPWVVKGEVDEATPPLTTYLANHLGLP